MAAKPQNSCDACSLPTYELNRTPNQPKLCKQQATLSRDLPVWDNDGNVGGREGGATVLEEVRNGLAS